jgi:Spy/CpxP family protein refolding chaperone
MKKSFVVAAVVAAGLAAAVPYPYLVRAQDQPAAQAQGGRGGRPGFGGPGHGRGGRMGGPMAFREVMRDLTDTQRQQVRAIHEKHAERIRPLAERAHTARQAVEAAILSGNTGNLQALSIEVGNAETELTFAQAQVQAEVFNVLTAEQKQKIAERRKEMEARRTEIMKRRQTNTQ